MASRHALPRIVRRKSGTHGFGVFAAEPIAKNIRIIDYAGELLRNDEECEAREDRYLAEGHVWMFKVNRAWIRALRPIRRGEELTYDYMTSGEPTIPCRCRPGCTNKI